MIPMTTKRVRNQEPNEQQKLAITNLQDDLLVAAGAGSGKTWVLTERYMEMLVNGARPAQIVAITFTELAASEMKRRVRDAVQKTISQADSPDEKKIWRSIYNELEIATISTIHGFCMRLLKEHPVEAGIDPLSDILEPDEANQMLEEAANQLLEEALSQQFEQLKPLYLAWGGRRGLLESLLQAHDAVQTFNYGIEQMLADTEHSLEVMRNRIGETLNRIDQLIHVHILPELDAVLADSKKKVPQYAIDMDAWVKLWQSHVSNLRSWDGSVQSEIRQLLRELIKKMWRKSGSEALKEAHGLIKDQLLPQVAALEIAPDTMDRVRTFSKLVEALTASYRRMKNQRNVFDFHDLEGLTAEMLQKRPEVAVTYRQKLKFIMVDEFQDTNRLQTSIINKIAGDQGEVIRFMVGDGKQSIYKFRGADVDVFQDVEDATSDDRLIDMGDNFRTQAGIINYINDFFAGLMQTGGTPDGPRQVRFAKLTAKRDSAQSNPCVEFLMHQSDEEEESREGEADQIARRIRGLVDGQAALVYRKRSGEEQESKHPVRYGDIAILFSATTHMSVYEQALQRYSIPYTVEKGRQFYKKQEITDLYSWLTAIANPEDEVALAALLRSPVFAVSDETLFWLAQAGSFAKGFALIKAAFGQGEAVSQQGVVTGEGDVVHKLQQQISASEWIKITAAARQLAYWQTRCRMQPLADFIRSILEDNGYLQVLLAGFGGEQRYANVLKLIDLAETKQRKDGFGVDEFVAHLQRMREDEISETEAQLGSGSNAESGAVRLMTVHASKGLEFPVVILPDLKRALKTGDSSRCMIRPKMGMGLKAERYGDSADDGKLDVQGDGLFLWMRDQERQRDELEEQRKLYVAMTRARDYLILAVTKVKIAQTSWQKWIITEHLGYKFEELPPGILQKESYKICVNQSVPQIEMRDEGHSQKHWVPWRDMGRGASVSLIGVEGECAEGKGAEGKGAEGKGAEGKGAEGKGAEGKGDSDADYALLFPVGDPDSIQISMLSASALMAFQTCNRRFYYRYLFKLPEQRSFGSQIEVIQAVEGLPDQEEEIVLPSEMRQSAAPAGVQMEEQHSDGAHRLHADIRGTMVHELFEQIRTPEDKARLIREQVWNAKGVAEAERQAVTEYLEKMADRYLKSPWFQADSFREQAFYLRIDSFLIHGFIDLVVPEADGTLTLVDFKTNEIRNQEKLAELTDKYRVQLQLYALAAEAVFQKPVKRAVLYFLDADESVEIDVSRSVLNVLVEDLKRTCMNMMEKVTIEAYPMTDQLALCRSCGYRTLCGRSEGVT